MRRSSGVGGRHVVVVGLGNIGSFSVSLIARMGGVGQVTLVDFDVYETENLQGQEIAARQVGMKKVLVQARRLRKINPGLDVIAIPMAVESIPVGQLRADAILGALDSRNARQRLAEIAWGLGVPYIDAGVLPSQRLARVSVFAPGPGRPCLECGWDAHDYAVLEQAYPCRAEAAGARPTRGPAALGALAAALQAMVCEEVLGGDLERLAGRQVLLDAMSPKAEVSLLPYNSKCRFGDHEVWRIRVLQGRPEAWTLREVFALGQKSISGSLGGLGLRVGGARLVTRARCSACGRSRPYLLLQRAWKTRRRACRHCGGQLAVTGFDLADRLDPSTLTEGQFSCSLASLGLVGGDVFSIEGDRGAIHFEIRDR